MVERNENSYQLDQEGRLFILKTSLIAEKLKLQCYDIYDQSRPYIGIFSLSTLKSSNPIFNNIQYIDQSRQFLNSLIERKNVRISLSPSDLLYITFYFSEKNKITLGLSRENKNYQYINQRIDASRNPLIPHDQQYISQSAIPLSQNNIPNDNYSYNIMQSPNDINKINQQQISLSAINNINNYPQDYQKPINNNININNINNINNIPNNSNYQKNNNINNNNINYSPINSYPSNENNFQQQKNIVEIQNYNNNNNNQMRQLENENLNLREELERVRVGFEKYANETSNIEKENQNLKQENENLRTENNMLNTELEKVKNENIDLDNSLRKIQEDCENLKNENEDIKVENENLKNENENLKNMNENLNQRIGDFDNENELENLKNDYYKLNNQITILQNENNTIKTENENLKNDNNNLLSENENLKNNNEELLQQLDLIQKNNLNKNKNDINQLQRENSELKKKLSENYLLKKQINDLQQQIEILSQKNNNNNSIENDDEKSNDVKGDIIHNMDELELITKKINKDNKKIIINLLYKASADSDKASVFHNKCDGAKNSIVLVETKKGKRFGGFTTCSWSGECIDKNDPNAFIFSFDTMKTYDNIPGDEAIGCYPKFGPIFLGCQIKIFDEAFKKGGTTFEKDLNFATTEDYELTGGERVFEVKDIEVYEVIIS